MGRAEGGIGPPCSSAGTSVLLSPGRRAEGIGLIVEVNEHVSEPSHIGQLVGQGVGNDFVLGEARKVLRVVVGAAQSLGRDDMVRDVE